MNDMIKRRIKQIKNGKVPEGYSRSKIGILPENWSVVSFDDKFSKLDRKNDEDNQNVLTISAQQGLISQQDYYNASYASENKKGYSLLYKGDFSYNKSYSGDYLYGAIKRLDKYEKGIVSPLYICFEPKEDTNSEFYLQYFEAGLFNREIYKIAQEGARNHGLLNVSITDFFKTRLINPPCEEQQKIAEILMQCDKVIELHQNMIDETKKLKKVFMSKMFPKNGENVPEIRFSGFTDPWEQRKVQDIYKITRGYVLAAPETSEALSEEMPYPVYSSQTKNNGLMGYYKDYLYENAITWTTDGANAGTVNYREGKFYCTNVCGVLLSDEGYANKCAAEALNSVAWKWVSHVGNPKLMNNVMGEIPIFLPKSIEEQNQISEFFEQIDTLITLHQRELQEWQNKKKALMQLLLTGIVRVNI